MDARKNASVLQEKAMSVKFPFLGGGGYFGFGGGVPILFYGRADFSDLCRELLW